MIYTARSINESFRASAAHGAQELARELIGLRGGKKRADIMRAIATRADYVVKLASKG
jgi:ethanolamine utilization microcompartment shell protein EutL